MQVRTRRVFVSVVSFSLLCGLPSFPASIIVGGPADSSSWFPFGATASTGTRYQQAYASSAIASGPVSITGIEFFRDPDWPNVFRSGTYTISLSTISQGIDTLSQTVFDTNLGADNKLFTSVALAGNAPDVLTFAGTPFMYDPAAGNLLLDIKVGGGGQNNFAAYFVNLNAGGTFSRYYDFSNQGTAQTVGVGLVTGFIYNEAGVPEPSTCLLMSAGVLLLLAKRRRLGRRGFLNCKTAVKTYQSRSNGAVSHRGVS